MRLHGIMEQLENLEQPRTVYLHNLYIIRHRSQPQEALHAGTLVVWTLVAGKKRVFVPCFPSELL